MNICNRGDELRKAFADIGTLRSILPNTVNVRALTAICTKDTMDCVIQHLSMKEVSVVGANTGRSNIKYIVKPLVSQEELCSTLADELLKERTKCVKNIVFCYTLLDCGQIYAKLKRHLGNNITEPPGLPNIVEFRLINFFTAASTVEMKAKVLTEFCKSDTNLRLVIATSAFGLGVDCPDIGRVINCGAPNTTEELIQQSGRAGRNGNNAEAILYYKKVGKHTTATMEQYGTNKSECRRRILLTNLLFCRNTTPLKACKCCDLCETMCNCNDCM